MEAEKIQVEVAVQTGGRSRRDSEDVEMVDRLNLYEDLSGYEDEDEAPVVAPPTTKKQAAPRPAAKAGKKSRPAKTLPQNTLPSDNSLAKAIPSDSRGPLPETHGRYHTGHGNERDFGCTLAPEG
ncbi:hypothetical protein EV426DRAFT_644790 [Tirmania nivea]|nr:hypothetical protein EV426DRAFT_644790 [Tirmania nivea]